MPLRKIRAPAEHWMGLETNQRATSTPPQAPASATSWAPRYWVGGLRQPITGPCSPPCRLHTTRPPLLGPCPLLAIGSSHHASLPVLAPAFLSPSTQTKRGLSADLRCHGLISLVLLRSSHITSGLTVTGLRKSHTLHQREPSSSLLSAEGIYAQLPKSTITMPSRPSGTESAKREKYTPRAW